jgi:hypothetical protein
LAREPDGFEEGQIWLEAAHQVVRSLDDAGQELVEPDTVG